MTFERAQAIADAILYEGYLLYPYRASSDKNRVRFQFGVVAPRAFSLADGSESWEMQTECLVEAGPTATLDVRVRFLQLQARTVEAADAGAPGGFSPVPSLVVDEEELLTWDEAVEGQVDGAGLSVADLLGTERVIPFVIAAARTVEPVVDRGHVTVARIVRTRWPIEGRLVIGAEPAERFVRLRIRVENRSSEPGGDVRRDVALRHALLGCHTLLAIRDGSFLSLIDPPADAADAAATCVNVKTWPVLAGDEGRRDLVLSSPIILYDYPAIAQESGHDLFDGTEIDEILTLRIMTLGDDEKRAARATDPRARAIIDAADDMPPEILDRLHGAIRYLRDSPGAPPQDREEPVWPVFTSDSVGLPEVAPSDLPGSVWEPAARVAPDRAAIEIDGVLISKGASVRLRPNRRADSMDLFLAGRTATIEAVYESVDEDVHIAVTLDDDPARDLARSSGRFFYFAPDELEPLGAAPDGPGPAPIVLERPARSGVGR